MKSKRVISLLMAALSSTSSLMAKKNLDRKNKGDYATQLLYRGDYDTQLLYRNGEQKKKLRIRNSKNQQTLNLTSSGSNPKDTRVSVAQSSQNDKAKETLNLPPSGSNPKDTRVSVTQSSQNDKAKEMLYSAGKWVKNNPRKAVRYGALGAIGGEALGEVLLLGGNEYIRLPMIYKNPENAKEFKTGIGSSSVVEVVKRFGDSNKKLVKKQISRSNLGMSIDFHSERLACKMLSEWSKKDENKEIFKHIAKVVDYHYGLRNLFVTYEEGDGVDWDKQNIESWSEEEKLNWLHKVFKQVIDVVLFFQSKGFYHGDLHSFNYNVGGTKENPHVNVFDFGRFYKVEKTGKNIPIKSPGWDLNQILKGFIVLTGGLFGVHIRKMMYEPINNRLNTSVEDINNGQLSYGEGAQWGIANELELNTSECVRYLKERSFYKDDFVKTVIEMFSENRTNLGVKIMDGYFSPTEDKVSNEDFGEKLTKLRNLLTNNENKN